MKQGDNFQYEYFSSVTQRKVEWLWYPYIPYGKLTILQGDPGEGKSTFMLNIAALLTRGKEMPDGFRVPEPQRVVYQTAEDNLSDTVKPRLVAAGADCSRIAYIIDEDRPLTLEDSRIEKVIQETHARLFILDPLQAYLSQDSDMFSAGRMRQQLRRLADIASKHKCAIVVIGHMNKASGEKNLYRGLGSIDIAAIARSVLMISRDKDDPSIRYMFPVKSSLAPEGATIAFSLPAFHGDCAAHQIHIFLHDSQPQTGAGNLVLCNRFFTGKGVKHMGQEVRTDTDARIPHHGFQPDPPCPGIRQLPQGQVDTSPPQAYIS